MARPVNNEISAAESPEDTALAGGIAATPDDPAHFWRAVATGAIRLTPHEDALLWSARSLGYGFDAIAASITQRRAVMAGRIGRALQAQAIKHARLWREQYRNERNNA